MGFEGFENEYNRQEPIIAFRFFDLRQKGLKWRVLLHVAEPFHRHFAEALAFNAVEFYPQMVQVLGNAGFFPEINSVGLMKKSNTFVVRFNLTYAYNDSSAVDTMRAIMFKLMSLIQNGEIPNPYSNLINFDVPSVNRSLSMLESMPTLERDDPDNDDDESDDESDEPETETEANDVSSIWSDYINDKLFNKPKKDDDDDENNNHRGGNVPVPIV